MLFYCFTCYTAGIAKGLSNLAGAAWSIWGSSEEKQTKKPPTVITPSCLLKVEAPRMSFGLWDPYKSQASCFPCTHTFACVIRERSTDAFCKKSLYNALRNCHLKPLLHFYSCLVLDVITNFLAIPRAVNLLPDQITWRPEEVNSNMVDETSVVFPLVSAVTHNKQCNICWFHLSSGPYLEVFSNYPVLCSCFFLTSSLVNQFYVIKRCFLCAFFAFLRY